MKMSATKQLFTIPILLLAVTAFTQQPSSTSAVKTVEVKASVTEAEVGQQVKLTAVAKDAAGKVVSEQPSSYFAGPFDIAAADDRAIVRLFGPGEVTAGGRLGGGSGGPALSRQPAPAKKDWNKTGTPPSVAGGHAVPLV